MAIYKEIVTKAVVGKGKKDYSDTYTVTPDIKPSTVLGCWIINHNFKGYPENGKIIIDGSYDVNIWYSYDNDTKTNVINKKIEYTVEVVSPFHCSFLCNERQHFFSWTLMGTCG